MIKMCEFLSYCLDRKGHVYYIDKPRRENSDHLDSHSLIAQCHGLNEDLGWKYELITKPGMWLYWKKNSPVPADIMEYVKYDGGLKETELRSSTLEKMERQLVDIVPSIWKLIPWLDIKNTYSIPVTEECVRVIKFPESIYIDDNKLNNLLTKNGFIADYNVKPESVYVKCYDHLHEDLSIVTRSTGHSDRGTLYKYKTGEKTKVIIDFSSYQNDKVLTNIVIKRFSTWCSKHDINNVHRQAKHYDVNVEYLYAEKNADLMWKVAGSEMCVDLFLHCIRHLEHIEEDLETDDVLVRSYTPCAISCVSHAAIASPVDKFLELLKLKNLHLEMEE